MSKITLSVDDGCASDIRVAELCTKYGIECVFYLPVEWRSLAYENGYTPLSYIEAISIARNFEVGSHTVTHRHLTKIPLEEAYAEIFDSQAMLQSLFKQPIEKFCPPRGYSNESLNDLVLKHYKSYRLTKGDDSDGYKLVHVHRDSGANENQPWLQRIETLRSTGITKIHCWLHSYDLDRQNLWGELEETLKEFS